MRRIDQNGIPVYQFENLAAYPEIRHGVFTRQGGVSPSPFNSLNVGNGVGDKAENVRENRRRIAGALGGSSLVFARQVHGRHVRVVDGREKDLPLQTGDALVTDMPGQGLAIQVADCQAVLLFDTARKVVANIHSGWRGSVGNIIGKTVAVMTDRFDTMPADIVAGVGPSLGPCCAEFVNFRDEIPQQLWAYRGGADHFDFWAMSRDQLRGAGVRDRQIEISGLCTRCRTDRFFSYRGEKTTGRLATVIGLCGEPPGRE